MKYPDQWPCHFRALAGLKNRNVSTRSHTGLTKTVTSGSNCYRFGVTVYVESDPDWSGPDIYIDPQDTAGIAIFREFAQKMADHYKNLKS